MDEGNSEEVALNISCDCLGLETHATNSHKIFMCG